MKQTVLIEMSPDDLQLMFLKTLQEHERQKAQGDSISGTCSINQAAKIIGISHTSAKKLIESGILKTTADQRRIHRQSINDYLQNT